MSRRSPHATQRWSSPGTRPWVNTGPRVAVTSESPEDIDAYMDGKEAFIKRVDEKAAVWRRQGANR